jgi:membrane protein implicated in regulation of membrane protease activity
MLCVAELVVPTAFTLFVLGLSAFLVSLVTLVLPLKMGFQVALWMLFSVAFVFLSHRLMPKRKVASIQEATEAKTLTEILPGETGRVIYEGNSWPARCDDEKVAIAPQQKVYVVRREGTTLIVMPENMFQS